MKQHTIAVLGGTGFVGHYLCQELANIGHKLIVPTPAPERHRELNVIHKLSLIKCSDYSSASLQQALSSADVIINLIGILNERSHDGQGFKKVHVDLVNNLIAACRTLGIRRILHMSALGANANSGTSQYLTTKGIAEELLLAPENQDLLVTIFRPSIIFGHGDSFFTRFAKLLKLSPGIFLLPCHNSIYAPVYVQDVVQVFCQSLDQESCYGSRYDLCGPKVYTLKDLVKFTAQTIDKSCAIIGLNDTLSRLQAHVMEYLPGKPFSVDNYLSTKTNSVCSQAIPKMFALSPRDVESIVPTYLGPRHRNHLARYQQQRRN